LQSGIDCSRALIAVGHELLGAFTAIPTRIAKRCAANLGHEEENGFYRG
jgi:hypothetical protein